MCCSTYRTNGSSIFQNHASLYGTLVSHICTYRDPGTASWAHLTNLDPMEEGGMAPEVNLTEWRKGSQLFEVNRKLALDIVADTLYYPKFKEFCQPACCVDEHYFPTMLSIKSLHLLANRSLTYIDWSRGGSHPATFGRADITEDFFRRISVGSTCIYNDQPSSLCSLFARKFSPSDLEPLLNLASKVFGF